MARVRFGDVVHEVKNKVDRKNNPYEFYVAGGHIHSDDIIIRGRGRFATDDVGPAFIREFHAGQVLYLSRNAYLKKVAVADFDGVVANTTFVLETKDENILCQRLLPFIMLSNGFTNWSVMMSKGSTNPYVLFSDIAGYEFDLPDMAEQRKLARVLWAVNDTIEAYRKLMGATEELVRGQFVEMFGGINSEGVYPRKQWADVLTIINGKDWKKVADPDGLYPVYGSGGIMGRANSYLCPENSIVMGRKGTIDKPFVVTEKFWNVDTTFGVVPNEGVLHYLYLFWYCKQLDFRILNKATTLPSTTRKDLLQLWINVPPYELQQQFADFVYQADKSKSSLQKALTAARNISRKIISDNLR